MTVYLLNNNIFINIQNKHEIVQTLLKWLFWTSINLDLDIKKHYFCRSICINTVCLLPPFCSINVQYNLYIYFCNCTF